MELVCARLDLNIDDAAVGAAEFRGIGAGLNLEFLDRIHAREDDDRIQIQLVIVDAVEQEIILQRAGAVGAEAESGFDA